MRVWLDDRKLPPSDGNFWVWIKTSEDLLDEIHRGNITYISFDHDLGTRKDGSIDEAIVVAKCIEELAAENKLTPIGWDVHSENPVGRDNIIAAMTSAERYWRRSNE